MWRSPTSRPAIPSSSVRTTIPRGRPSWIGRKCRSATRMGSLRSPRHATAATSSGWSIRGTAGCRHSPCSPCLQVSCVSAAGPADTPAGHRRLARELRKYPGDPILLLLVLGHLERLPVVFSGLGLGALDRETFAKTVVRVPRIRVALDVVAEGRDGLF